MSSSPSAGLRSSGSPNPPPDVGPARRAGALSPARKRRGSEVAAKTAGLERRDGLLPVYLDRKAGRTSPAARRKATRARTGAYARGSLGPQRIGLLATAFGLDPDTLTLSAEEHHRAANSWTVGLRTTTGDEYDVVVGFVDGYAGSVRIRHGRRTEIFDSVGSE